jgi:hypothetical protein
MPGDLLWEDVECFFDIDLMGSLPDVHLPGASVEDWQAVVDLVRTSGWRYEYGVGGTVLPLPPAGVVLSRPADAEMPDLRVWPAHDVLAIFRFLDPTEIDFDIDIRELQGQDRLDLLCDFFATIGRRLGKPVLMTAEGDYNQPVLGFDVAADRVIRLAEPW